MLYIFIYLLFFDKNEKLKIRKEMIFFTYINLNVCIQMIFHSHGEYKLSTQRNISRYLCDNSSILNRIVEFLEIIGSIFRGN